MKLFDRVIELKVGDTEITGLEIAFEIEKDESPEPNPCHIDIYNLSPENRTTLSKYKYVPVLLKAGYRGDVSGIFEGDMLRCTHIKEGPTWKTVLTSGDGLLALQTKRINKSYTKDTPIRIVIEDLARQIGLPLGTAIDSFKELNSVLSKNFAASGNPIKDLCRMLGKQFYVSVQNQMLQLRRKNDSLQSEAINLSPATGLIASPEIGKEGELIVRSLLMAEFSPGRKVHINSAHFDLFATIETVRFKGSTLGSEWEAEMRCRKS